jgi:hypothetical protein
MASFKSKPSKVKYLSNVKTLDELHRTYLTKLDEKVKDIPSKKDKLATFEKTLVELETNTEIDSTDKIKLRSTIRCQIQKLEDEIVKTQNNSELLEYISKAGELLVNYYNITSGNSYNVDENNNVIQNNNEIRDVSYITNSHLDKKNINISKDSNDSTIETLSESSNILTSEKLKLLNEQSQKTRKVKKPVRKRRIIHYNSIGKSILQFLPVNNESTIEHKETMPNDTQLIINRATLQDKYLMLIDKNYACEKVKTDKIIYCTHCKIEKTLFQSEGCYVCKNCGETEHIIMESEIPSHKELANEKQKYPYKKINHLKEKLNQFQSKESADVPEEICNVIKSDLRKNRIRYEMSTPPNIRTILKKHKLTAYYEHLQQIYCKISGATPITLSRDIEETIINKFQSMQESFHKYCPPNRSNFLSYSYVLNKLFRILGMDEHAKYFGLLKSKEKLREQDIIWNKICKDMDWRFFSSF